MARLRVYQTAVDVVREVSGVARRVERHDRDLARQMRRASTSIALNIAEGELAQPGNRRARYHTAMGSARETMAAVEVSVAAQYIGAEPALVKKLDGIVAVLYTLTHNR